MSESLEVLSIDLAHRAQISDVITEIHNDSNMR